VANPQCVHDRLVTAAGELFYAGGITATGVDTVVRAAGVTKPTLYAHFPSKAALVTATLERRYRERVAQLEELVQSVPEPEQRPVEVFRWLGDFYARAGSRGCGFLNAAAELTEPGDEARAVIEQEKRWLVDLLRRLCSEAGVTAPDRVARQLLLLVDGVAGHVVVHGPDGAAAAVADAITAAVVLMGHAPANHQEHASGAEARS
jgi:AcrR family transcriptional regulator